MIHWTKLKKAVEDAGGIWTDREAGEAFLAGLGAMPDVSFDMAKPYSTFHGEDSRYPGAFYLQGGIYFNKQGKKVG